MTSPPITFAAVAQPLAKQGWRPFPGYQASKTPAMRGWPGLNGAEWDDADLVAAIGDYQPDDLFCCCLAAQPEIVAIDLDIVDHENAAFAERLADNILGRTPLVRIGFAPKQIRVYRNSGGIHSRKLHPLEIFAGTGQSVARLKLCESSTSLRFRFSPKIWTAATFEFCNTINPIADITKLERHVRKVPNSGHSSFCQYRWPLRTFQTVSGRSSVSRNADLLRTALRIGRVSRYPNLRVVGPKSPRVRRCEFQESVADRRGIHACLTRHNAGRARTMTAPA
jgi:hypothetical protein